MLLEDPERVEHFPQQRVGGEEIGRDRREREVRKERGNLVDGVVELVVAEGDEREIERVQDGGDGRGAEEGVKEGLGAIERAGGREIGRTDGGGETRRAKREEPESNQVSLSLPSLYTPLNHLSSPTHPLKLIPRIEQQRVLDAVPHPHHLSAQPRVPSQTLHRAVHRTVRPRLLKLVEMGVEVVDVEESDVLA